MGVALGHGDGVVALLRVEVLVPGRQLDFFMTVQLVSPGRARRALMRRPAHFHSLGLAPRVDGVAGNEGDDEVGDLDGEAAEAPEDVAVKSTLQGLLGEGGDGCWANASMSRGAQQRSSSGEDVNVEERGVEVQRSDEQGEVLKMRGISE